MKSHTKNLGTISTLFQEKEKELKETIGNLSIQDVKEDSRFSKTVTSIKGQILLQPVKIGDPKITGNREITRSVPHNQQMIYGREIRRQAVTVSYPCTGSDEVFKYRTGASLTIANVYSPSNRMIDVEVELQSLDKSEALKMAMEEMATTFMLIENNNPDIERWSNNIENRINEMTKQKRSELLDFYS